METTQQQTADISTLAALATELALKNSWVRNGVKSLMEKWAEVSECGEEISSETEMYQNEYGFSYRLVTGEKEIRADEEYSCVSSERYFWTVLSAPDLRIFLGNFQEAVSEIATQMQGSVGRTDKALEILDAFGIQDFRK